MRYLRLLPVLALVGVLTVSVADPAMSATAKASAPAVAGACDGSLVGVYPFAGGRAQVEVYYSSRTGNNCLKARGVGSYYGAADLIGIAGGVYEPTRLPSLDRPGGAWCIYLNSWGPSWAKVDCSFNYEYYAGPITFPARNRCIEFYALIAFSPGASPYSIHRGPVHCG